MSQKCTRVNQLGLTYSIRGTKYQVLTIRGLNITTKKGENLSLGSLYRSHPRPHQSSSLWQHHILHPATKFPWKLYSNTAINICFLEVSKCLLSSSDSGLPVCRNTNVHTHPSTPLPLSCRFILDLFCNCRRRRCNLICSGELFIVNLHTSKAGI